MCKIFVKKLSFTKIFTYEKLSMCEKFENMEEFERPCCIRGYHICKEIWDAAAGEALVCQREPQNGRDRYAVVVKKEGTVIGHLPRNFSTAPWDQGHRLLA